jgi:hypothetical protein
MVAHLTFQVLVKLRVQSIIFVGMHQHACKLCMRLLLHASSSLLAECPLCILMHGWQVHNRCPHMKVIASSFCSCCCPSNARDAARWQTQQIYVCLHPKPVAATVGRL